VQRKTRDRATADTDRSTSTPAPRVRRWKYGHNAARTNPSQRAAVGWSKPATAWWSVRDTSSPFTHLPDECQLTPSKFGRPLGVLRERALTILERPMAPCAWFVPGL